jgi:hypothetical protein
VGVGEQGKYNHKRLLENTNLQKYLTLFFPCRERHDGDHLCGKLSGGFGSDGFYVPADKVRKDGFTGG